MKTLIIHDRFHFKGGAERLVLILANHLQADILTEFWEEDNCFKKSEAPAKIFTLAKKDLNIEMFRYFRAQFNFFFRTRKIIRQGKYDLIIFSGNHCLTANIHTKKTHKKFVYCHSPVRHVFDLYKHNKNQEKNILKKFFYYHIGVWGIRIIYWLGIHSFKTVIANSQNISNRLKKYCHKKTTKIIWPPIDTSKFKWLGQKDYYLSFGRVDTLKRVGDIVKAFQKMPNKKLIVSSSGDDFENVKQLAKGYQNIKILGWVDHQTLTELVGNCIASIYIPIDEDAGMAQLESMSAGKPVIVNRDGGFLETVTDELNGKFIPKNYKIKDIMQAVNWMTPPKALSLKENCQQNAKKYSQENFLQKINKIIQEL